MAGYISLRAKISILVSANLNSLVNRALSVNHLAVFDEYLNRMRAELAALQSAEGFERGRVKTTTRQSTALEAECIRYDQDVDRLLLKGERVLAAGRQATLSTKRALIDHLTLSRQEAQAEIEQLSRARSSLTAQIELTEAKRLELRSLLQQRKASEIRARTLAGVVSHSGAASHAEEILERVRQDTEVAQGRSEAAAMTMESRIYDVIGAEDVELQLQEREERLRRNSAGLAESDGGT
jgi:phage shock protein A